MPRLPRRPRLAPALALILSCLTSTAMIVLAFGFSHVPNPHYFLLIPIATVTHDAYYLFRILYLDSRLGARSLSDWPHTPIFPSRLEGKCHVIWTYLVPLTFTVCNNQLINDQDTIELRWTNDKKELLFRGIYILQLIASTAIFLQTLLMYSQEYRARCSVSHIWHCSHCQVMYTSPNKNELPIHTFSVRSKTAVKSILVISLILNGVILYVALKEYQQRIHGFAWFLLILSCVNIPHHLIHLGDLMTNPRIYDPAVQPLSTLFNNTKMSSFYPPYMFLMASFFPTVALIMVADGSVPLPIGALWMLEAVVLIVSIVQISRMAANFKQAQCVQTHSHEWVCSRMGCEARYGAALEPDPNPKCTTGEDIIIEEA